jgi:hypothetical protein
MIIAPPISANRLVNTSVDFRNEDSMNYSTVRPANADRCRQRWIGASVSLVQEIWRMT